MTDIELRLINPRANKFRLYGITECTTLFGEPCLRIVWGRIGHRRLRERSETFATRAELEQRRSELLARRRHHGYDVHFERLRREDAAREAEREIVEAHGLPLASPVARDLVSRWHAAARELACFIAVHRSAPIDLVDASTLGAMYANAAGFA
jgi:predicted DNA-binding WGR domain protein